MALLTTEAAYKRSTPWWGWAWYERERERWDQRVDHGIERYNGRSSTLKRPGLDINELLLRSFRVVSKL